VASANCVVLATQIVVPPVIAAITGNGFTVTVVETLSIQPLPFVTVYLMIDVPAATPVTKPLEFTVATPVLTLVQTPLAVASDNCVVLATQMVVPPVIATITGNGFTVTVVATLSTQPLPFVTVYRMIDVPALIPLTKPVAFTVATPVLTLVQTPLAVASANCVVLATQIVVPPVIAAITGNAFTVTVVATLSIQPLPFVTVYLMMLVPAATPVTKPLAFTVANPVLTLVHTPLAVASDNCVVLATQTLVVPVIAAITGNGFTVTVVATLSIQPLPLVTV
jgi:hypothetical protein